MKSADTVVAAAVVVAIAGVVILSIFLFSGQAFNAQRLIGERINSGTEAGAVEEGAPAAFREEVYADQESVVLRIIPTDDGERNYHLTSRVEKGYGGGYDREENLTGISPENPIVINVSRMGDEWVDIFVKVRDQSGLLVWESESGYG